MKPNCSAAFTVVRFVVVPHGPEPQEFRCPRQAERAAKAATRRLGRVSLYLVMGELGTELWRRPQLLATFERGGEPS